MENKKVHVIPIVQKNLYKSYSCYRTYIIFIPKLFNNCYIHPYIYIAKRNIFL